MQVKIEIKKEIKLKVKIEMEMHIQLEMQIKNEILKTNTNILKGTAKSKLQRNYECKPKEYAI